MGGLWGGGGRAWVPCEKKKKKRLALSLKKLKGKGVVSSATSRASTSTSITPVYYMHVCTGLQPLLLDTWTGALHAKTLYKPALPFCDMFYLMHCHLKSETDVSNMGHMFKPEDWETLHAAAKRFLKHGGVALLRVSWDSAFLLKAEQGPLPAFSASKG